MKKNEQKDLMDDVRIGASGFFVRTPMTYTEHEVSILIARIKQLESVIQKYEQCRHGSIECPCTREAKDVSLSKKAFLVEDKFKKGTNVS